MKIVSRHFGAPVGKHEKITAGRYGGIVRKGPLIGQVLIISQVPVSESHLISAIVIQLDPIGKPAFHIRMSGVYPIHNTT